MEPSTEVLVIAWRGDVCDWDTYQITHVLVELMSGTLNPISGNLMLLQRDSMGKRDTYRYADIHATFIRLLGGHSTRSGARLVDGA